MGSDKVVVGGEAVSASQNPSERAARLDRLFRRLDDDEFMRTVKAHLREYFTVKAAADAAVSADAEAKG